MALNVKGSKVMILYIYHPTCLVLRTNGWFTYKHSVCLHRKHQKCANIGWGVPALGEISASTFIHANLRKVQVRLTREEDYLNKRSKHTCMSTGSCARLEYPLGFTSPGLPPSFAARVMVSSKSLLNSSKVVKNDSA